MPFIPLPSSTELTLLVARLAGQLWWRSCGREAETFLLPSAFV